MASLLTTSGPPALSSGRTVGTAQGILAVLVLALLQRPEHLPAAWVPSAGLGLALAAWWNWRGIVLFLAGSLLGQFWMGSGVISGPVFFQTVVLAAALGAIWFGHRRQAQGPFTFDDPQSAALLLILAGLVLVLASAVQVGLAALAGCLTRPWTEALALRWSGPTLGVLALGPPLLLATPFLQRRGWLPGNLSSEPGKVRDNGLASLPLPAQLQLIDWLEVLALSVVMALISVAVVRSPGRLALGNWQLWGVPLLVVVWAGMRQGAVGATLVPAAGAVSTLEYLRWGQPDFPLDFRAAFLLQANLLAQCSTALLVGASSAWLRRREKRYHQVVSQIPVVLYSGRVIQLPGPGRPVQAEIVFVSPPAEAILGKAAQELLGDYQLWLELVHPDDREVVVAAIGQLARQNQPVACEYRLAPGISPTDQTRALAGNDVPGEEQWRGPRLNRWMRDILVPQLDVDGQLIGWEGMILDVTEQRALSDDLRRTTSMFQTLITHLPTGVLFLQGPGGWPILANQRARQLLGQREDRSADLEHLPASLRLHRPDGTPYPAEELPVWQALRRGLVSMRDDVVVHRPDGRQVPLVCWGAPVDLNQSGRVDAAVWVLEDLTALRQAEAARSETEGRLRTVIESLAEGLLVQDRHGRVVECNSAAKNLLGPRLTMDGPSGPTLTLELCREDGSPLPAEEHPTQRVLRTGIPVRNAVVGLPRVNDLRWLLINSLPLAPNPGEPPAGAVTTFLDVTEQVQAQNRLRQSEERQRRLIDTLPVMLMQFDRDLRLTYCNPATTAFSGYRKEEVETPDIWTRLIHADDRERVIAGLRQAVEGEEARYEYRYRARDGSEHSAFSLAYPTREEGQVVGVTVVSVDVTRERRLEQELQRSQRLELVAQLTSGIAHDFNNMLGIILGVGDAASRDLPEDHPARQDLGQILDAAEQASRLARQLLDFSKPRKGTTTSVDLAQAARRALTLARSVLPRAVKAECSVPEQAVAVRAEEWQLQQVVMNLILNAREAMPQGGQLWVRVSTAGQEGRLEVQDNGVGMSEEVIRRVFEPFFTTKERGTGLGLAVSRQIVESFGGRIEVHSQPGQGTTFTVCLPLVT